LLDFSKNRIDTKSFIAKVVRKDMLCVKVGTEVSVSYYAEHYGKHMWRDIERDYLVYYESEIELISESGVYKPKF
jgi:hypothetical protein